MLLVTFRNVYGHSASGLILLNSDGPLYISRGHM